MPIPSEESVPSLRPLRRRLFGYKRLDVDAVLGDMQQQNVELRTELCARDTTIEELNLDLGRSRQEIRYWEDRHAFVESEIQRARDVAERIEGEARERASAVETDAKERSLRMIDRVCSEANAIIQHARDEAREMSTRSQDDVVLAEQRVQQLRSIQAELQRALRGAIDSVEGGMRSMESTAPSALASRGTSEQRALPAGGAAPRVTGAERLPISDFGKSRAVEASHRFVAKAGVLPGLERESTAV